MCRCVCCQIELFVYSVSASASYSLGSYFFFAFNVSNNVFYGLSGIGFRNMNRYVARLELILPHTLFYFSGCRFLLLNLIFMRNNNNSCAIGFYDKQKIHTSHVSIAAAKVNLRILFTEYHKLFHLVFNAFLWI